MQKKKYFASFNKNKITTTSTSINTHNSYI